MAQDKRTFLGGINKDVDPRLIKNPDYTEALNIRVASSSDNTVGSVENIEGNEKVQTPFYNASQEIIYEQDGNLYGEVNPATIFHQEVIRISGWEESSAGYNFNLYSLYQINVPNEPPQTGTILIGSFSWSGLSSYTGTGSYLYSQFSQSGPYNSNITIHDYYNGDAYTASVKSITANQYSTLTGGYFEIVIEADTPGVNFVVVANSSVGPTNFYNHLSSNSEPIPIVNNGNVTISIRDSFETGGDYNASTTEEGFIVSPDGAFWEVGNRTLYRFTMHGIEPTSPEDPDPSVTLFSYRNNDDTNAIFSDLSIEVLPFVEIKFDLFNTGDPYEFTANQNKISEWLHTEFSQPKTVLCEDLPLSFEIPPENFIVTCSNGAVLSEEANSSLDVMIVGPPGVKFKLAYQTSGVNLVNDVGSGNTLGQTPVPIFSTGLISLVTPLNLLSESSLQLATGIYDNYQSLLDEILGLEVAQNELMVRLGNLRDEIAQAELDLIDQTALTTEANANYQEYLGYYGENQDTIQGLDMDNALMDDQIGAQEGEIIGLQDDLSAVTEELGQLEGHLQDILSAINAIVQGDEQTIDFPEGLSLNLTQVLSDRLNTTFLAYEAYIVSLNDSHASEMLEADDDFQAVQQQLNEFVYQTIPDLNSEISVLEGDITDLNTTITGLESDNATLLQDLADAGITLQEASDVVADLNSQLEELNISDRIARKTFDQAQEMAENISNVWTATQNSYQQLNPGGGNIYEEDFSDTNTFDNDFTAYGDIFLGSTASLQTDLFEDDMQDQGYIQPGYLRLYNGADSNDNYTATSLGSSNLNYEWAAGNTISGSITFELHNQSGSVNIVLTNFLDPNGDWYEPGVSTYTDTNQYFHQAITLEDTSAPQTFSFEFTIPNNFQFNQYNRRFVMVIMGGYGQPVQLFNTEVRLTNLLIAMDGASIASQISSESAFEAYENYYPLAEEIEEIFIQAENSNETLSGFYNSEEINGYPVQEYVFNTVIPGYALEAPLWDLLQEYQREVLNFALDIQNQLSVTLNIYGQALSGSELITASTIADLMLQQEDLTEEQSNNTVVLEELQEQVESMSSSIASAWQAFGSPYTFTVCTNIVGPEPGLVAGIPTGGNFNSTYGQGNIPIGNGGAEGIYLRPKFSGPQGEFLGSEEDKLYILTGEQLDNLFDHPHGEQNNFFYYLRQNIPFDGYRWSYNSPEGSGYGAQEAYVYWVNFDETINELSPLEGSGPYPSISEGLNGTTGPFVFPAATAAEQIANTPMAQLAIVYDNGNPDNLPCLRVNPAVSDTGVELDVSETITSSWENNPYKLKDFKIISTGVENQAIYYMVYNQEAVAAGVNSVGTGGRFLAVNSYANLPELRVREE